MKKRAGSNPRVGCGSCRQFDGLAWCRHWNFHTDAESPICRFYRPLTASGDVARADDGSADHEEGGGVGAEDQHGLLGPDQRVHGRPPGYHEGLPE